MTPEEIDDLTGLWQLLTDNLDYHAKSWFSKDDLGDWKKIPFPKVHDILLQLGVGQPPQFQTDIDQNGKPFSRLLPDPDRSRIIQQFLYRDQESHPRLSDDLRQAQLRFNL